ncbi:MAG: chemotaxis protein CheD [Deltaproteobacteria bacterium RBG_13_58_19]|nr:MAG: chemotaxis protein CheD [Deltaproteobacteria bacterium RBG_13_58_19]
MQLVVGVADLKVSNQATDVLVTHALGSCIGVAIYDPVAKVGGILHYMLPESGLDPRKAQENPFMFADTGIPRLFRECYQLGAQKQRLRVKVAGGSQVLGGQEHFQIGRRNYAALRKIFLKNNVLVDTEDVGGVNARTLFLEVATGKVWVRIFGQNNREL